MGERAAAPGLYRQARLGTVERLNLRFFIDRKHDGMGRQIDIESDCSVTPSSLPHCSTVSSIMPWSSRLRAPATASDSTLSLIPEHV